ncbi:MAG: methyltransferase domain-containing protein [Candidatus Cloacimonetes bacterium]|nr:methyltransferase domain-containing protein [Candidatus Cloacimonadota bacterium]
MSPKERLYSDLSWLWPMWGDPAGEYADYVQQVIAWIGKYGRRKYRTVLDLGCGGGKCSFTLKDHYEVMGLDLSPDMLARCQELNPGLATVCADMRSFDLKREFDIILVNDAISYITTEGDLRQVLDNCFRHLEDDGLAILTPDICQEEFIQNETNVFHSIPHPDHPDTQVVYITINYDPDPADNKYECLFLYVIRSPEGLRVERDLHHLGVFSLSTWQRCIRESGFDYHLEEYTGEEGKYRTLILFKTGGSHGSHDNDQ